MSFKHTRVLVAALVAAALWSPPALATTCEEEYSYCYYLASLESDERARDAKQNECDHNYWLCTSQPSTSDAASLAAEAHTSRDASRD